MQKKTTTLYELLWLRLVESRNGRGTMNHFIEYGTSKKVGGGSVETLTAEPTIIYLLSSVNTLHSLFKCSVPSPSNTTMPIYM